MPDLTESRPVEVLEIILAAVRLAEADEAFAPLTILVRPDRSSFWACIHPVGLALVAFHLLANAAEAGAEDDEPTACIDLHQCEDRVVLEVADNGPGMAEADRSCAFAPFFCKNPADGRRVGLGLTTCHEVVHSMGGQIRIESAPGKGTVVVLSFPATDPAY
jgi:C4-dicarboxylate-specific signal transduction histidine kinase